MKNRENYVSTPSATLTQSGLLAVLLQQQRRKAIELARVAHTASKDVPSLGFVGVRSTAPPPLADDSAVALEREPHGTLESCTESMLMAHEVHTYADLLQQIHNALRIQHPEWVQPNGESPMCDSYEARLMELLDTLTRTGPNEPIMVPHCDLHGRSRIETAAEAN
jgi:hypothetical protein